MTKIFQRPWVIVAVFMLVSAVLALMRFNTFQVGAWGDDAHYVVMAESLATGQGIRLINFPDKPIEPDFNVGWPFVLAPVAALFPNNFDALKVVALILWLACIPLTYRLFAPRLKAPYPYILTFLVALNPSLIGHAGMLMAEPAYLFFSLVSLNLFDYWYSGSRKLLSWHLLAFSLCAVAAWQMRTVGLTLMAALPIYLLLKRQFKAMLLVGIIIGVCFVAQIFFNEASDRPAVYAVYDGANGQFAQTGFVLDTKVKQILSNAYNYSNELISGTLVPVFTSNISNLFARVGLKFLPGLINLGILLTIAMGIGLSLRDLHVSEIYMGMYALALLTYWWPEANQGTYPRFLVPMIPFLYFYLLRTIDWVIPRLPRFTRRYSVAIVVMIFMVGLFFYRTVEEVRDPTRTHTTDLSVGTTWIRDNTPADSVVMMESPTARYLYARRQTVVVPNGFPDIGLYLSHFGVNYILVGPDIGWGQTPPIQLDTYEETTLLPFIKSHADQFKLVFSDTDRNISVYQNVSTQ